MHLLIAVPALNEERSIDGVLSQLPRALPCAARIDVLVVDDGSADRTAAIAREAGARVVSHPRRLGLGSAFRTAVREALESGADVLATIDADGQFDPGQVADLLGPLLASGADAVTGTRFAGRRRPESVPRSRYWGNRFFAWLLNRLLGERLTDVSCGFRAYSREALLHLNLFGELTYTHETIFDLCFKGLRVAEVPVDVRYFEGRKSRLAGNLVSFGFDALKIIARTARDFKPLRFFGVLGGAIFGFGAILDGWMLGYFLSHGSFSPYKFVGFTGTALMLVGLLVVGFGLLADMLDRIRVNQERVLYQQRRVLYGIGAARRPGTKQQQDRATGLGS